MNIKNNLSLILGISIPVLMIIFVALSIYVPQLFVKPQYNFLYLTGNNNCYFSGGNNVQVYSVQDGRVVKNVQIESACPAIMSHLKFFLYDIKANQSKEIYFDEAGGLSLNASLQSPDGFTIVNGSSGNSGFFPFFYSGSDYYSKYISGHNISKKLNLSPSYYDFSFLGWVNK